MDWARLSATPAATSPYSNSGAWSPFLSIATARGAVGATVAPGAVVPGAV